VVFGFLLNFVRMKIGSNEEQALDCCGVQFVGTSFVGLFLVMLRESHSSVIRGS